MLLLIAIIAISSFSNKAHSIDVTYISQTRDLTTYWSNTYAVAKAAAKDLNINLTIVEGQGHHLYQAKVLAELVLAHKKPDLLIFHAYKQNAYKYFDSLEQAKIPFITYSNFTDIHTLPAHKQLGRPQGKYKYWLSEHHVENTQGAALLVESLIKQAKSKQILHSNKKLKVLALSGDLILQSLERSTGVAAQVSDIDNVILVQDIIANWSAEDARNKFKKLYVRHKGIDVVWASSDVMAIGALNGAMELGLVPNKDIFIGGFDWNRDAINKIKAKELGASAGGQFYHIAWLLVQVYDHFNKQSPFELDQKINKVNNTYAIIDQDNLSKFEGLTDINNLDDINFYCFTKTYTRQQKYNFSMLNLLHQSNRSNKPNCK